MPAVLSGRMDDSSWNSFCDKIDEALLPITKMKKAMKKCCFYPLALFVPLILVGLIASAIVATRSIDDSSSGESMKKVLPVIFLIAFVVSILWAISMANYSSRCKKKVNEEVEKVCYKTSTSHPGISFKVYIELHYMQVIVSNDTADALEIERDDTYSTSSDNSSGSLNTALTSTPTLTPTDISEAKKWKTAVDEDTNKIYYFHEETKVVTWENPLEFGEDNEQACVDDGEKGENIADAGIERTILFKQVSWETPLESDEANDEEENEDIGKASIYGDEKGKEVVAAKPKIDV